MGQILISKPNKDDLKSAFEVFKITIKDAFEKDGIGHLKDELLKEIEYKKQLLTDSVENPNSNFFFLFAKIHDQVVGTISFGPCGTDIKTCTNHELDAIGELGSLYVLPEYQGKGIGSALIQSMVIQLHKRGIEQFCLDSGYKHAQKKWIKKFGKPYKIVNDYWGENSVHMVWLCDVKDFIN
jgi:predicted N-acetyltransferase YhbS